MKTTPDNECFRRMKTISGCEYLRRKTEAEENANIMELCALEDVYIDWSMHDKIIEEKNKALKEKDKLIDKQKKLIEKLQNPTANHIQ